MNQLIADEVGTFDPKQVIKFSPADAAIKKMEAAYLPLKIKDVNDVAGFNAVHEARMVVKQHRVQVEKKRKELKADALEFGRKVDDEAKRITALMEPIEEHLESQEEIYNAEKARIKREAEEAKQRILDERCERLAKLGVYKNQLVIGAMDATAFEDFYAMAEREYVAKQAELVKEESERKRLEQEEAARLAAERTEMDRQRKELEAQQKAMAEEKRKQDAEAKAEAARLEEIRRKQQAESDRIEAEKRKVAEAEAERQRQIQLEQAKAEAAERARIEERDRIQREEDEARRQAEAEAREQERLEAMRPDKEKLVGYLDALIAVPFPVTSDAVDKLAENILKRITATIKELRKEIA